MNSQYVNSILNSVKRVFVHMLDLTVEFDNPIRKQQCHPTYEISSIISIKGALTGSIVLSYPKELAKRVVSEMLEEKFTEINDEAVDAISEIANMVTGVADTELELENVSYSLPTVFRNRAMIEYPDQCFVFSMPCRMDSGKFEVDIALCEISHA